MLQHKAKLLAHHARHRINCENLARLKLLIRFQLGHLDSMLDFFLIFFFAACNSDEAILRAQIRLSAIMTYCFIFARDNGIDAISY